MNAAINTINLTSIILTAGTQFRTAMIEDNVIDLMDLIERGVPFKTPIRLAKCNDTLYLTDGFHRIEAYGRLRMMEIPADQCVITDVSSIEEVRVLAAGANVQHGKGNTRADYHKIIKKLMEFGDAYMKNAFEPDMTKIAQAIGAARPAVMRGYNDYFPDNGPSLSQMHEERRNAAIMEKHTEGLSSHKIAALFSMNQKTVSNIIADLSKKPESGKLLTPESSPSTVPMASTLDRADTREDAGAYISSQLSDLLDPGYLDTDDCEDLSLTMDEDDFPPFDVLAATGWGNEQATHNTKSHREESPEEVTAEMLEKELEDALTTLSQVQDAKAKVLAAEAKALEKVQRIRQEAGINGITLSK